MSWTTVRGHRPVGVVERQRQIGDQGAELDEPRQSCSCGEPYTCAHIAALVVD